MVNVTYYIDKSNTDKNGLSPIKANITINYKNITKTVEKVKSGYWNKNRQRLSNPRVNEKDYDEKKKEHEAINDRLDRLQNEARKYFKTCKQRNIPVTAELAKAFLKGQKIAFGQRDINFWDAYDQYLSIGLLEKSYNTNRNRKTIYNKLKEFETNTGYKLSWYSIDSIFWDNLKEYILDNPDPDVNYSWNYLSAIADKFKAFMKWSQKRKYHNNDAFRDFSAPEKEPTIVYLTWDELKTLIYYKFESKYLQHARDFFCFGCLTGLRYVDLYQLTKNNVSNGTLSITTQKTNRKISVPLFPQAKTIIDRYPEQHRLLPRLSNQRLNSYIKKCCEKAEINTPTEYKTFHKNEVKKEFRPKYELIGSHTARKTFICLAYEKGLDIEMIKSITGITQEKTLKRYLQISDEKKKEKLNEAFGKL